jgi:hypothetical protein
VTWRVGRRRAPYDPAYFPTVGHVPRDQPTVIPYETEAEAIAIANDSAYALGGTVWSADTDRANEVARKVTTGTIGVNGY